MDYVRGSVTALAVVLGLVASAAAGPILTGEATYDPAGKLYTYSYTLDDQSALAPIDQIYIRVASGRYDFALAPDAHVDPAPFGLATYVGDGRGGFPGGTFFGWNASADWQSIMAGVRSGFWFTTPYAPSQDAADNYTVFSTAAVLDHGAPDGHLEYGRVVAPDFGFTAMAPEPGSLVLITLALAGAGLGAGWGSIGRYRVRTRMDDLQRDVNGAVN